MHNDGKTVVFGFVMISLCICVSSISLKTPIVKTVYGPVQGQRELSRYGRYYQSFTGIPFAKPPVGPLRFAAPEEPDSWTLPLQATNVTPVCIQRDYLVTYNPPTEGTEDCLYLNVYTPEVEYRHNKFENKLLPVLVFIHWGGYFAGNSGKAYLGPDYLMDKDIIVVTFNYRLGVFGFLTTLDDEAPGNYGFKDQVLALKWVQRNIEYFGGDKNKVTIAGQSAGAASVHFHLLSSESEGLFHQAISQSGNVLGPWAFFNETYQKQITSYQALFTNCGNETTETKQIIECLRGLPAEEILKTQDYFKRFFSDPLVVYTSTVEKKSVRNPNPFLIQPPGEYLKKGMFRKVPWITGVVKDEGILKVSNLLRNDNIRNALNNKFVEEISNTLLALTVSTTDSTTLYSNISNFYFGGQNKIDINNPNSIQGLIDVYSDRSFIYPLYQSLLLHLYHKHNPIYLYSFEYKGEYTYGDVFSFTTNDISFSWGTSHCDDLLYLFYTPKYFNKLEADRDICMSKYIVEMWTNFVIYGNPNLLDDETQKTSWKPLDTAINKENIQGLIHLLNITGNIKDGIDIKGSKSFYKDRINFWKSVDILENH
ncbi:juvenile hormone esterase-like [Rhynchophorus ferrugineus]|uniref:juvenile hormone esterase-like n=1 Tax=Rhynchophorus ferrugineus TaxID=354439 RepID=UPI003FCE9F4C